MSCCTYLSCYTPVNSSWSVARCLFKTTPYIPSVQELKSYCETGRQQQCPVFFQSLSSSEDLHHWPELEVVALALCPPVLVPYR
jgi:hypothetical protein